MLLLALLAAAGVAPLEPAPPADGGTPLDHAAAPALPAAPARPAAPALPAAPARPAAPAAADGGAQLPPPPPIGSRAELDALLASARGQVVVVHLWATWCEPCLAELPRIISAEATLRPRGVRLLSLAADPPENAAGVSAFARRLGAGFETRILTADPAEIARSLGLSGYRGSLPVTLVLDQHGTRRFEAVRSTRPGELEAAVAPLLPPL